MSRNKDDRRPPKATPRSLKEVSPAVKERVRKHALSQLSPKDRKTTNLYFNRYEYERGARIGPRFAPVELKQATVLVFADDDPKANFEHECRYILYDAEGNWLKDVEASFPPSPLLPGGTLDVLHVGVPADPQPVVVPTPPTPPCPVLAPAGRRYAVLFAGDCQWRHVNDLELAYRTLIGQYGFDPNDVFVLAYNGHLDPNAGPFAKQGGGGLRQFPIGSPLYQMPLNGAASAATSKNLKAVFEKLSQVIEPGDLLYIQTDGHGGKTMGPKGAYLYTYADPDDDDDLGQYTTDDLARDLKAFKTQQRRYGSLLAMMAQCSSRGFRDTVQAGTNADKTAFCSAADRGEKSFRSEDRPFCEFAVEWIIAERMHETDGTSVPSDVNPPDGAVTAQEAFDFAAPKAGPPDTPDALYITGGESITLSAPNPAEPELCELLAPVMAEYWREVPESQFYERLHRALPAVQKAVLPVLEANARELKKLTPRIRQIMADAFGKKPTRTAAKTKSTFRARTQREPRKM